MDVLAQLQLQTSNLVVIVPAVLAAITVLAFYTVRTRRTAHVAGLSDIEQRFRNVFSLMTEERKQALIEFYVQKHNCSRHQAMQIAVDARAMDEERW